MILSFDTSLPLLSVALFHNDGMLGTLVLEGQGSRNEKILPAIDFLLSESRVDRNELTLIAVTRGPGSFTGVRIGLAMAEGFALALRVPICAMSTHQAIAFGQDGRTLVFGDAGRGEFYVSGFDSDQEILPPSLLRLEDLEKLSGEYDVRLEIEVEMVEMNVAWRAGRFAGAARHAGILDHYADTTPIYVRLPEPEVKLRQKSHG